MSVLSGHGQIAVFRKGGAYRRGQLYVWQLNGGQGMAWSEVGRFAASMGFEIVDAVRPSGFLSSVVGIRVPQ